MFGFLKKKLKKSIEKISSAAKKSEEAAEEVPVEKAPIEQPELIEEEAAPQMPEEVPEEVKEEIVEEAREEAKEEREAVKEAVEEKAADAAEEVAREEIAEEELKEEKPLEPAVGMMEEVKPEEKRGILEKIGLRKPKIIKRIKKAVREKVIEEDDIKGALDDIQTSLLESDVALEVSEKIMKDLKKALVGKSIPKKHIETVVMDSIRNSLLEVLKLPDIDVLKLARTKKPLKIIFLGFNGTGKTTSIAKMAHMFKQNNLRSILAAGDTFRAASIEQLEEHGKRLDVPVIKHKYGADSTAVIFDANKAAEARGYDVVLADTAGRSHANVNLIDELKKICRVNKPDLKILTLDCLSGNDVVNQARMFHEAVGVDALILTKADVYDKGGAVLSATFTIKKPILYLGTGQKYEDLERFDANKTVSNLLD